MFKAASSVRDRLPPHVSAVSGALQHISRVFLHDSIRATYQDAASSNFPKSVNIVEVSPRDGLQNEKQQVRLIEGLVAAGLKQVEATSFVSPKWVPQLADAADVYRTITKQDAIKYPVLVPNMKGLQAAMHVGATEIAVFTAASEQFCKKNTNCSIEDSMRRIQDVIQAAKKKDIAVRGYVSCVVGCPYQGHVEPRAAAVIAAKLHDMGCYEVSMGDTIGVGTPASVSAMFKACLEVMPVERLAAHMHDTYGQALANILAALGLGVRVVDTAVAGLGGCPFAKGATGNVATEDVVYMLDGLGINHGVDMNKLLDMNEFISAALNKPNSSRAARALLAARAC